MSQLTFFHAYPVCTPPPASQDCRVMFCGKGSNLYIVDFDELEEDDTHAGSLFSAEVEGKIQREGRGIL